jgi:hypothetical protein
MRYKRKKVTIVATGLGFAITTRMLQRFPELTKKVNLLISVGGFSHHDEFLTKPSNTLLMRYGASLFSNRFPAFALRAIALRPSLLRLTYNMTANKQDKPRIDSEVELWRRNDPRTYMDTTLTILKLDLLGERVNLPLCHVQLATNQSVDDHVVAQHLNIIYDKVRVFPAKYKGSGSGQLLPPQLKRLLARNPS